MPIVACFNPGSNSLKFDLIETCASQSRAGEGRRLISGMIDNLGRNTAAQFVLEHGLSIEKDLQATDVGRAATAMLDALPNLGLPEPELAAVRVVHGGERFQSAVVVSDEVIREIEARNELAPLHNPNAVKVIQSLRRRAGSLKIAAAFDTAFHSTIPEVAWRYPIDLPLADRLGIRKFGFHGISHRYQMEHYCHLTHTPLDQVSMITTHLESGSSVCAIRNGKSVDTSMGFTPLEGIMMGTRSGSVDPAILPFLMRHEQISAEDALNCLEKKSGLLGISGQSLDTRVLRKSSDSRARLAMAMFAYRVRLCLGAYLAVLGEAKAIVFAGGIGENTPEIRWQSLQGLQGWGVEVRPDRNAEVMTGDQLLSEPSSRVAVWVIHSDEGLQLAHECAQANA